MKSILRVPIGQVLLLLLLVGIMLSVNGRSSIHAAPANDTTLFLPMIMTPDYGPSLLPNGSFEAGWYHPQNISELQIPTGWHFKWQSGHNALDPDPWNEWVRPEARVLSAAFLPTEEHDLFIWDGDQTVKVFKGYGAISFELTTAVPLDPGTYLLEIFLFPDLVVDYVNGEKVWAPDPLSGEVKLITGSTATGWMLPQFGTKNRFRTTFVVTNRQTVRVGAAMRGRWAIRNNGWFMDDWRLYRLDTP